MRRRILFVAPETPDSLAWGFAIRVHNLAQQLGAGHDVTLLAYLHDATANTTPARAYRVHAIEAPPARGTAKRRAQLHSLGGAASYHCSSWRSAELQAMLDRLVEAEGFDVVQVESSQMSWLTVPRGPVVVLDEHNVEHEVLSRVARLETSPARRLYGHLESRKVRREAARAWRASRGCVATSPLDAATIRRTAPSTPVCVVPNAVDLVRFAPGDQPEDAGGLVFVGSLNYRPNADAVLFAARHVLPRVRRVRPDTTLTVVGGGASPRLQALAGDGVRFAGAVADVRPHLASAGAVLVPLRAGGGTRLKLLEALAMGKAVVSTGVGCEGIEVRDGVHLLVAETAAELADRVVHVLGDTAMRRRLGASGRALVERSYGWEGAAALLDGFHQRLLNVTTTAEAAA